MPRPPAETYPSIDAETVQARFRQGTRLCEWTYEDTHDGKAVGHLLIESEKPGAVTLSFGFRGFAHLFPVTGTQKLSVVQQGSGRTVFICPRCTARRAKLFMVRSEWACRVCHQLMYRSSREGSLFRLHREKADLSAKLANGCPKRMRRKTHDKMLARLEEVTRLIAGRAPPPVNLSLGSVIQARWSCGSLDHEDPSRR